MASGIWTAVSGANARTQAVDTVANNLANADTMGFKKDLPTFKEYLTSNEVYPEAKEIHRVPLKESELHPTEGRDKAFVITEDTITNFKQGHLKVTQNPLDVALDGPGFLEVSTPQGPRYTRAGGLKITQEGRLVTTEGFSVLSAQPGGLAQDPNRVPASGNGGANGEDVARQINLRDRSHLMITEEGELYAGADLVARLSVKEFNDPSKLRKVGGLMFSNPDPANIKATPPKTVLRQGVIETSNVNPVEEMTNLIKANRMFEHDLRAIKTYDEFMRREANDIGKL